MDLGSFTRLHPSVNVQVDRCSCYVGSYFSVTDGSTQTMESTMNVENLITRVAQMIAFGVPVEDIRAALIEAGCSEEQAYLVFIAGRIMAND